MKDIAKKVKTLTDLSLKDSEIRYRRLFEATQDGILILDARTGMIEDVNPYLIKMLGFSRKEFIKKKLWEVGAFKDIEASQDVFEALQKNEYIRYADLPLKTKSGGLIPVEFVSNVYLVGDEKVIQCNIRDITEHKQADEALRSAEARYRILFEQSPYSVLLIDLETGKTLEANDIAHKQLGYTREEFAALRISDYEALEKPEETAKHMQKIMREGSDDFETLHRTKSGEIRNVHVWAKTLQVSGRSVFYTNFQDITQRKQAEGALRESEERYRLLVETLPDGVVVHSQGRIVFANPACTKIIGAASPADLTGKPVIEFVHPDYRKLALKRIQHSLSEGVPVPFVEEKFVRLDGTPIDVEVSAIPFSYIGKPAMLTVFNDITERKQAEEALELAYSQLTNLYINLPEALFSIDIVQNKMLQVSPAHEAVFGYSCDEFFKNPQLWYEIIVPEDKPIVDANYPILLVGRILQQQFRILRPDGKTRWIEAIIKPTLAENGKLVRLDGVASDVTERKQREEEMTRLNMAVNNSGEAIFMTDREGVITFVNPGFTQLYGYTADEIVGKTTPRILKSGVMKPEDYAAFWQILLNKQVAKGELTNKTKDGPLLNIESWSSPILNQQEEVIGFLSLQRDITQRKQAEQEIAILAKFASENPNPVLRLSRDGIVMYANVASGSLLGMWDCAIGDSAPQFWRDLAAQALARRENKTVDIECDGKVYSMVVTPVAESGYVNLYGRDITERERAEERIRRQLEHLTALSAIERFIASVFDLKLSLSEILTHVTKELGVDAADILILNPNSPMLEYGAERGFRTKGIRKVQVRLGESYAGRAALERQLVRIPNLRDEPDNLYMTTLLADEDFVCYYGVPLIFMGRVKGVLEVFHRTALEPDAEWFNFLYALAGQAAIAIENATLFENLQRSNLELTLAYDATIEGWSHALDLRDKETEGHTQRVTEMTVKLARAFGSSEVDLVHIRRGALLHDIGKMGVPDGILLKPGPLTAEEWVVMKRHPVLAYEMLSPIRYLHAALDIPYCHHEKWDGTGYPRGLKGEQIPLTARIFAVVDVWDALNSDRPYRAAWPEEKVLDYVRSLAGTHFDPQVVKVCLESGLLKGQKSP